MKLLFFIIALLLLQQAGQSQDKYYTKTGRIDFVAVHDKAVSAVSRSAVALLETKTGHLDFSVLVKSFEFKQALMQEKFNHTVLETDQFPQADFKGDISNNASVNYSKAGEYDVEVKGTLTLHGVSKPVTTTGKLIVSDGKFEARSTITISLGDYNISNPGVGETVKIVIDCFLEPL